MRNEAAYYCCIAQLLAAREFDGTPSAEPASEAEGSGACSVVYFFGAKDAVRRHFAVRSHDALRTQPTVIA